MESFPLISVEQAAAPVNTDFPIPAGALALEATAPISSLAAVFEIPAGSVTFAATAPASTTRPFTPTSYDPEEAYCHAEGELPSLSAAQKRALIAAVEHDDESPDGIFGDGTTDTQRRDAAMTTINGVPVRIARVNSHEVRTFLQVLDRDERVMYELHDILDGSISFDASQVPDRMLDVTVLDPEGRLLTHSPHEQALEPRRFVRAIYARKTKTGWVRFPKFTGPITAVRRQGAEVTISALGKEVLFLDPFLTWEAMRHTRKTLATVAIRRQAQAQGERRIHIHEHRGHILGRDFNVPRFAEAWPVMVRMARQIHQRLFYNGEGRLVMKNLGLRRHDYTFTGRVVLSFPEINEDYSEIRNEAVVRGPDPQGCQLPVRVEKAIVGSSPISPRAMSRDGVPRRAIEQDEIGSRRRADLEDRADHMLRGFHKEFTFDCLPIPQLAPWANCRVRGRFEGVWVDERFTLKRFTLPLTVTEPMTIGDWRRLPVNYGAHHRRHAGAR